MQTDWSVQPQNVAPFQPETLSNSGSAELDKYELDRIKGPNGCALTVVGIIGSIVALMVWGDSHRDFPQTNPGAFAVAPGLVALLLIVFALVTKAIKVSDARSAKADRQRKAIEASNLAGQRDAENRVKRAEEEARNLTKELKDLHSKAISVRSEAEDWLDQTSTTLRTADREFNDNAFGPFWDAVQQAAGHLAAFNESCKTEKRLAETYYGKLKGRTHSFPDFPVTGETLPDPSSVVQEMRRVVRMGQTNFQFANIWEHRGTRQVLMSGFHTLSEALSNMGSAIDRSIADLDRSIGSVAHDQLTEQRKSRRAIEDHVEQSRSDMDDVKSKLKKLL